MGKLQNTTCEVYILGARGYFSFAKSGEVSFTVVVLTYHAEKQTPSKYKVIKQRVNSYQVIWIAPRVALRSLPDMLLKTHSCHMVNVIPYGLASLVVDVGSKNCSRFPRSMQCYL